MKLNSEENLSSSSATRHIIEYFKYNMDSVRDSVSHIYLKGTFPYKVKKSSFQALSILELLLSLYSLSFKLLLLRPPISNLSCLRVFTGNNFSTLHYSLILEIEVF